MKYIDAERLRAEIEKLKKEYDARVSSTLISESLVYMGKVEAINKALCIIDSLRQEHSEVDLEKEIVDYWTATGWSKVMTLGKFKVIARHFYELGKNSK